MKPLLINQTSDRVPRAWLGRWLKELARVLQRRRVGGSTRVRGKELVLVFVSNDEIRRLNRQYRGKDYATDVLSFASAVPSAMGELVLSWHVLKEQSKRTGLSERGELGYMIVHGVLHLLGYDHETEREQTEMFALQDAVYAELESRIGFR